MSSPHCVECLDYMVSVLTMRGFVTIQLSVYVHLIRFRALGMYVTNTPVLDKAVVVVQTGRRSLNIDMWQHYR